MSRSALELEELLKAALQREAEERLAKEAALQGEAEQRHAKEAAQEAARLAGNAASTTARADRAAAEANFPWYVPYLKLRCREQQRIAIINGYIH